MATRKKTETTAVATKAVGTDISVAQAAAVEELRKRLLAPSGDKIKISEKQFTLPSGDVLDYLDAVIVDFVYMNTYYEGAYDPSSIVPPNCFALNSISRELAPSPNSPDKQEATNCASCWANEFGSAGKGKACQNRILAALLPTDAKEDTPFSILSISPTGIRGFSSYLTALARAGKMPYETITHVTCNPNVKYDVAIFDKGDDVEDVSFLGLIESRLGEARERLLTEPDVSQATTAKPAAKAGRQLKAPAKRR